MLKLITTFFLFFCLFSCQNQQKLKNSKENITQEKMYRNRITIEDLQNTKPIVIKTKDGYQQVYSVIIYTDNSSELIENGIAVQSTSSQFVTALIKKEDLEKIYLLKSVKSISLPKIDYLHNENLN